MLKTCLIVIGICWLVAGTVSAVLIVVQEKPYRWGNAVENTIAHILLGYFSTPLILPMLLFNAVRYFTGKDSCWGLRSENKSDSTYYAARPVCTEDDIKSGKAIVGYTLPNGETYANDESKDVSKEEK